MLLSENKNTGINPHTYRYLNFYNNTKKYTLEKRQQLQNPNSQIVFLHFDFYKLIHIYHPEKKFQMDLRFQHKANYAQST